MNRRNSKHENLSEGTNSEKVITLREKTNMGKIKTNIDPTLRTLGGGRARYQILQLIAIRLGAIGAACQLFVNMFIGRAVEGLQCATPGNLSLPATNGGEEVVNLDWNSTNVEVGQCQITVSYNNLTEEAQRYPCPYGYQYGYERDLSFRTEFDLVCDRKLLGSLVQTMVIAGQGIGAVLASMLSDRFGRKWTLIGSQFGLLVAGLGVGLAPSYTVLAVLKFLMGGFQQGVVTGMSTMGIELFPMEHRSQELLASSLMWGTSSSCFALVAYLMRHQPWRHLQYAVSAVSFFICLIQLWYVEESLRWLLANGKKEKAVRVLKRAARVNRKDVNVVLNSLQEADTDSEEEKELCELTSTKTEAQVEEKEKEGVEEEEEEKKKEEKTNGHLDGSSVPHAPEMCDVDTTLTHRKTKKLTTLDIFRHKRLLAYAVITWLGWYTIAFAYFSLYVMSTTLHGNRFLNFFFTALMDLPSALMLYYLVDKVGRRNTSCGFFVVTAFGLISCGVFRVFKDSPLLGTLSVVSNTIGALGATSVFTGVFFYTPEYFPTNMRNQALGVASLAGRLGGMMGPFMTDLAEISVWAPGALAGGLCLLMAVLFRFLPETKKRELPHTINDIKSWKSSQKKPK